MSNRNYGNAQSDDDDEDDEKEEGKHNKKLLTFGENAGNGDEGEEEGKFRNAAFIRKTGLWS